MQVLEIKVTNQRSTISKLSRDICLTDQLNFNFTAP